MVVGMVGGQCEKAQIVPRRRAGDDGSTERRYRALAADRPEIAAMNLTSIAVRWTVATGCALVLALAGAAPAARAQAADAPAADQTMYGTVRSIDRAGTDRAEGSGALVGGILGAVIGRQFADTSHGRNVGSAVGAAAGAFIGHEIEKNLRRERAAVRIAVTLDDGSVRSFEFRDNSGDLRVGDRVRVDGRMLYRVS
jgi:outer membrane lipoprotein SlyB